MKLRAPLSCPQFLFASGAALLLLSQPIANAQQATFRTKGAAVTQQGTVVGADAAGVRIQVGAQTITLPPSAFESFDMAPPPEYRQGYDAFTARDYPTAQAKIKSVVDKYKGLPTAWAQYSATLLGDIYIATNDLGKAESAYNDARRLYPAAAGAGATAEIGPALIAVKRKDYGSASAKVAPIIAEALKEKAAAPAKAMAFSKAFLVSGQVKEAQGDLPGALEDYLRTVTIFYQDPAAVSVAQERADALRARDKDHPVVVP